MVSANVLSSIQKSSFEFHGGKQGKMDQSIDQVYKELMGLRETNRLLEKRVKTLEKQNIEIAKDLNFVGNNEPTRPQFTTKKQVKQR